MITSTIPEVSRFWLDVCEQLGINPESSHCAYTFADPKFTVIGDGISHLAVYGQKRATAHLKREFEEKSIPIRNPGDYWTLLSVTGLPIALLRVTNVAVTPFNKVSEDFAATEGEGDLSLAQWTNVHRRYFKLQCAAWGEKWREDIPVVCENFGLIYTGSREPPS